MTYKGSQTQALDAARLWHAAGCSAWPPMQDGTKRPMGEWKQFMSRRPTLEELEAKYRRGTLSMDDESGFNVKREITGVGLITGEISGNLEMLELEGEATNSGAIDAILWEAQARGVDWLWHLLVYEGYSEWTPSGGLHMLYRVDGGAVPGNTKIARRPATDEELAVNPRDRIKTLSETRGEGGYVVVAPSGGTVHPSGEPWSIAVGRSGKVPTIGWDDRCLLHEAIKAALDQMPAQEEWKPGNTLPARTLDATRPGDDFQLRATWEEILTPHGWHVHHRTNVETFWTRPGKDRKDGWSATTGFSGDGTSDRLYVWSSSTVFDTERPYNKFSAYALLEHGGDFGAAARTLGARGYGDQSVRMASREAIPLEHVGNPDPTAPAGPNPAPPAQQTIATGWNWQKHVIAPQIFRRFSYTSRGAGDMFADAFHELFKFQAEEKLWWFFDGKLWRPDRKERHEQAGKILLTQARMEAERRIATEEPGGEELRKFVNRLENATAPSASRWGRQDPRVAIDACDFDPERHWVAVGNGMLHLKTREFAPHDPKFMATKMLAADFLPDASAPRWSRFLEEVLPDPKTRDYVQRAAGHALLGDAEQRALFLLHGDSGSGKSQFVKVLELIFGDYAETAAAATFSASSRGQSLTNDLNDLRGKRFVSLSETDQDERMNEALLKRITGGDTAKSRGLYKENSKWRVEFSLWMATNYLPRINSDDNAIWRRLKPIHFPNVISRSGTEEKRLGEKMFEQEAAGILNWLLEGVDKYLTHELEDTLEITTAVETYRAEVDDVTQFVKEATADGSVRQGTEEKLPVRQGHQIYVEWCKRNNIRHWLGERRFAHRMEAAGFMRRETKDGTAFAGIGPGARGMLGTMNFAQSHNDWVRLRQ